MLNLNFHPFPDLKTGRLSLRQLRSTDNSQIYQLRNNAEVNKFIDRPATTTLEEAEKFIQKINSAIEENKSLYWAITLKEKDVLIGTICLWNISKEKCKVEIGYELFPQWQDKGIMREAVDRVIFYAFEVMKMKIIEACTHKNNEKSGQLLIRNQFRKTGFHSPENAMEIQYVLEK